MKNRLLMCAPDYFDIKYEINPWMNIQNKANNQRVQMEWYDLVGTLTKLGVEIEYVSPNEDQPDLVFTANAGLIKDNKAVISHFRHKERQGEEPLYEQAFKTLGLEVVRLPKNPYFEGEGDALFAGDKLFTGYGFRSEKKALNELCEVLGCGTSTVKLVNEYFYHLDTCFCPLNEEKAIYYPGAFDAKGIKTLTDNIDAHPIPEEDAMKFACNAIVLNKDVVLQDGCEETKLLLEEFGYTVHFVNLDEFHKAGGSAKCLVLKLEN